ncbi:MAG: class I SAM-dependent methyltransferase [Candidatus Bathyarchaeota archaeon]|nr:class I SAM-dependent methyltransferase [Candidatus Bathyarchaeota archaeon]
MVFSPNRDVQKYYDKKGSTYDDYSKQLWSRIYDAATWRLTEPYIPKDPAAIVFDAAGGTGKWAIPLAKCGPKVVLGDLSEGMLKTAKEKIAQEGLQQRVEVKECDLRSLDFDDQTFDLVFCEHALCFIKEQETVIKELVRVLKRGCPLLVSGQNRYVLSLSTLQEGNADPAFSVLTQETQFVMRGSLDVYALSPDEFRQILETNGVAVEKIAGKLFTMPLAVSPKQMSSEKYPDTLFRQLLQFEVELSNKADAAALAGHFQAIGYKR